MCEYVSTTSASSCPIISGNDWKRRDGVIDVHNWSRYVRYSFYLLHRLSRLKIRLLIRFRACASTFRLPRLILVPLFQETTEKEEEEKKNGWDEKILQLDWIIDLLTPGKYRGTEFFFKTVFLRRNSMSAGLKWLAHLHLPAFYTVFQSRNPFLL